MKISKFHYWILAARSKILLVLITPVLVASTLAFFYHSFKWIPTLICLAFALLAQIISKYLNDYFDFVNGADRADRLDPERIVHCQLFKSNEQNHLFHIFPVVLPFHRKTDGNQ